MIHFFFSFVFISWRLITLQYCSGDSVLYLYILFESVFHCRLLQDIEYSSLCHEVGHCLIHKVFTCQIPYIILALK